MLIDEIRSAYYDRNRERLECKTIEIRADLYAELLHDVAKYIGHYSMDEPTKVFGMEIKPVSANEDYRFIILD